ncbi:thioesterase [Pseudomonas aeruginosa]|nr:thioesterase [Pseudomonas aeruginosa PA1]AKE73406.1 thioesterase [Pseudomonas aeruginosa]AKO89818.1 thioesterase [Pseudomonas aeruginosa DSM 50071 = NBRC 12689]AMA40842.1 thioesterase [Pseudomonas aeruginosa DHS01]KKJ46678.1 thioesterase [Pseudomonas aeruginosa MRSN 321]KKJ51471.1 thioesterase [Pseudomonas aeruginosa MRSN 317]KUI80179.1 thioesterase [Pseudomonas aeruginosa 0C2E]OFO84136.1 thioesterase [Pseudomonas sp. HMSC065H01]OFR09213.1 thioesterase [Pseudomonas sp. HMSC065H02]OFR476
MTYSRWRRKLPAWLAVRPVELPGRGARMAEPLQTDLASLAQQLARELHDEVRQGPYAMLGHSLGALLACEVLYALRELGCPTPLGFFACGTAAPSRRAEYDRGFAEPKSDAELIADLRDLQGTPEEVLGNRELMSLTLPILRADFLLCGSYRHQRRPPLACPIRTLGGREDKASEEQLLAWAEETRSGFELELFDGGHFFIHQREAEVLAVVERQVEAWRAGQGAAALAVESAAIC